MKLNKYFILFFISVFIIEPTKSQPENYFRYPLDSFPHYVSPFGSLRDNHFHSGADLSTRQQEGKIVYAAATGYVSRIKVQSGGYGKALYIAHPNGKTTVYGHLQNYYGDIEKWVKKYQYANKTYEFDFIFNKPLILVSKGDSVAISGNSGTSTGPHLHFEIRDSKTEQILNIAQFGLVQYDTIKPYIEQVNFYQFVPDGLILTSNVKVNENKLFTLNDSINLFLDTILLEADLYGIGINAWDLLNNNKNPTGIYSYTFWLNNVFKFKFALNRFSFDKTKYINTHIDYPYYRLFGNRVQKAFLDDGNKINLYEADKMKGKFYVKADSLYQLMIKVEDNNNNKSYYLFIVKGKIAEPNNKKAAYLLQLEGREKWLPGVENKYILNDLQIYLDDDCLYDTMYVDIEEKAKTKQTLANIYRIQQYYQPLNKSFSISIKPNENIKQKNKLLLGYATKEGEIFRGAGGHYTNGVVTGNVSSFGFYTVLIDTLPPKVEQVFVNRVKNKQDSLSWNFRVTDNLTGIKSYNMYLNNHWVLAEYDAKNNLLTYFFDDIYEKQLAENRNKMVIKIIVSDAKGNTTTKEFKQTIRM
ncbi:MAG: M23 family metallopeptidase [Bacteroidia bacterium]